MPSSREAPGAPGSPHEERLAEVGLAASMLAHEVGNLLNSIDIHGQVLRRRIAALGLEEELGTGLELMMGELRRIDGMLLDFRELSRPASLRLVPTELHPLLEEVLAMLEPAVLGPRVETRRELDDEARLVLADADKLRQVFLNLSKNALEAMPEGGRITVRARLDPRGVVAEIEDTGVGIPEGVDPFEAFRTTKAEGSGLGLAVVRRIVGEHQGSVSYRATPGGGTTFEVVLPRAPAEPGG